MTTESESTSTSTSTAAIGYRATARRLRYLGAALAYLLAVLYLFHPTLGAPALVVYVEAGTPLVDPRPAAFVLSAVALLVGVKLVLLGVARRPIYLLGVALLVAHLGGYVLWHATGHGGFLPWREVRAHDAGALALVASHLAGDGWALVAKFAEAALLSVLVVLFAIDR